MFTSLDADVIKIPVRVPVANAICERFVGSIRRELLDRILIVNTAHARQMLREYETHFNTHRPHRSLNQAAPLRGLPSLPADPDATVTRRDRLGGLLHEYAQVAQPLQGFGHPQGAALLILPASAAHAQTLSLAAPVAGSAQPAVAPGAAGRG